MRIPAGPQGLTPDVLLAALPACWPQGLGSAELVATPVGEGRAFDGVLARIGMRPPVGPTALVVKWANARRGRVEQQFYAQIAPHTGVDVPACYGAVVEDASDRSLLFLEDLTHCEAVDYLVGADVERARSLARAEGGMHARMHDHPALRALPTWPADAAARAARYAKQVGPFGEAFGQLVSPWVRGKLPVLVDGVGAASARLAAGPRTLVHGDLHIENVLFRAGGTPVFLDWTGACRGPGPRDFLRVLEALPPDARAREHGVLVDAYIEARTDGGRPTTRAALEADLRAAAVLLFVGTVGWAVNEPTEGRPERIRVVLHESIVRAARLLEDLTR